MPRARRRAARPGRRPAVRRGRRAPASPGSRRSRARPPAARRGRHAASAGSRPASSTSVPSASAAASLTTLAVRRAGPVSTSAPCSATVAARREQQVGARRRRARAAAARRALRRAGRPAVRAAATETCWPSSVRSAVSARSTVPGSRIPGTSSTLYASTGSAPSTASTATGRRRGRAAAAAGRRRAPGRADRPAAGWRRRACRAPSRPRWCREAGASASSTVAGAAREPQRPPVRAAVHLLDPGHGSRGEERQQALGVERRPDRAAAARACPVAAVGRPPTGLGAQRRGRHPVDLAHRVVELPHAREARRERDVRHAQRCRLHSSRAVCARWARASASGPAPSSAVSTRFEVPLGVAEPGREPGHAVALHHAVGDQPHGAGGEVGADVPVGRARHRVGQAAAAGAVAALLGRARRRAGTPRWRAWGWWRGRTVGSRCRWSAPR